MSTKSDVAGTDRRRKNAQSRQYCEDVRDIGPIPPVGNTERRAACQDDLKLFLETYFPRTFRLGWAPSHLQLIESVQEALYGGGLQAIGYPRGSGKTSICERSVIWAVLYGHSRFGMVFTAEASKSAQRLKSIKMELLSNPLLLEDFPEICFPIWKSEGIANRANHQTTGGEPTHLRWGATQIQFPFTPESVALGTAGSVIGVGTITGAAARGPLVALPTGENLRPDLILIDDPQTRTSAKSPSQVQERLEAITGDMLGMAGPDRALAALLTCTVIFREDLADQILDPEKYPDWRGIRVPMIQRWPSEKAMELWGQWNDVRVAKGMMAAHDFYEAHRSQMDRDAEVYWAERVLPRFLSALESAMYLWYRSPATFMSEYQCQPEDRTVSALEMPKTEVLLSRRSGALRGSVPEDADHLTAFIDVQKKTLWYMVMGFRRDFTGYVLDYGVFPDQGRRYYTKADSRKTYDQLLEGAGHEASLENALTTLVNELDREWYRSDGNSLRIEKGLIDASDGNVTETIYTYLNRHHLSPLWLPSHGIPVTATMNALEETKRKPGERVGLNWRLNRHPTRNQQRFQVDTNWWKTFVAERWNTAIGDPGSYYLPGIPGRPDPDPIIVADHLHSEFATLVEVRTRKRELLQWELKPNRDNEFFDAMVGCSAAASLLGCKLDSMQPPGSQNARKAAITADNLGEFFDG